MPDQTVHYIFLGLLISMVAFAIILVVYYYHKQEDKHKKVLNYQKNKRNGELSKGFLFSEPKLEFTHNGNKIKIDSVVGKTCFTIITVKLIYPTDKKMAIHKERYISKLGKAIGMQDIEIGFDEFDRKVILKGSDENFIRQIITFDIQDMIISTLEKFRASIYLNNDLLKISFPDLFQDESSSDIIIDLTLNLVDKIREASKF